MSCTIFTQASHQVGYGHIYECLAIAEYLSPADIDFLLLESSPEAEQLVRQRGYRVRRLEADDRGKLDLPASSCLLMNLRDNSALWQKRLKSQYKSLILIDELGDKQLFCDVLINFSICPQWHHYLDGYQGPQFLGADFYPLRKEFIGLRQRRRAVDNKVLVSMGGADRTRTTLRLAEAFSDINDWEFTYVIGPGFGFGFEQIREKTKGRPNHRVINAPDKMAELMAGHRLMFSAGGDTLFEAAYLGIPTLVVWEDPHEELQGRAFADRGASLVVGPAGRLTKTFLDEAIDLMRDPARFDRMAGAGPALVDGSGCSRITAFLSALPWTKRYNRNVYSYTTYLGLGRGRCNAPLRRPDNLIDNHAPSRPSSFFVKNCRHLHRLTATI
jgi:spore coat polysaccharide biosynthesis predicted glycosyltransferase SpsG